MPELPEVETTRRGIAPYVEGKKVERVIVRSAKLRLPIPTEFPREFSGQTVRQVQRRGKYLILRTDRGSVILHLGMSGHLSIVPSGTPPEKHDHLDIRMGDGLTLRLTDPRRFGLALWTREEPLLHPLLARIGPEPLEEGFDGVYLFRVSRSRRAAIKPFILDGRIVAGVGNIYASEALFRAGINPQTKAGNISARRCRRLVQALREVLDEAIAAGGTTLRDFRNGEGKPGYFALSLAVYGREGEPCRRCGTAIRAARQGGRSTFFCTTCQK